MTSSSRRDFLLRSTSAAVTGGLFTSVVGATPTSANSTPRSASAPGLPGVDYKPVVTPNGVALPHRVVDGVKVFHLVAEDVEHEFAPGMTAHCWGYNGRVHGPTIEAVEGDHVRIYVTNRLDVPTTVHWHGLKIPNGMDGVGGLTQRTIHPGETFKYEFVLRQHGTLMYHSHHDEMTQMAMGMMGMFIIHPRQPEAPPPDRDYVYLLSEWKLDPGARRPDPNEMMDFNVLTLNAKISPATDALVARTGERVRIRIGNLSAMDHHPIHLHGHSFVVTETDGGVIPEAGRWPEVSVLVPVGSTRTIEFVADNPGDWALHCHMTHHVMTQMGHGIPNLIGVDPSKFDEKLAEVVPEFDSMGMDMSGGASMSTDDSIPANSLPMISARGPFGYITMSGMFTVLEVREQLTNTGEPAPYEHPTGTVADAASKADLEADGIEP
ncbi:MAG: copper oxidase [Planctomycetes bacterium]|nr:copper oxidase [Planctomycetota bacterium]